MKTSTINELKKELIELPQKQLVDVCLHLAKYKKDNKEYLDFLLFQAHDVPSYITSVKEEIDNNFSELTHQTNLYFVKKSLRKLLRIITKYIKYCNNSVSSIEMLMYFCLKLKQSGIPYQNSQLLVNMYDQQIKKINTLISKLHEDLQLDYYNELENL